VGRIGRHQRKGVLVANPAALGTYLRDQGLLVGRTWSELGIEHTEPTRITHPVAADVAALDELTGDTAAMAKLILSNTTPAQDRWRVSGELDLQMRQATA
jgi:hypothetical protein